MNRRSMFLIIALAALAALVWLAFLRFSNVAYMTSDFEALTGWPALRAGWPVFVLISIVATVIGLLLGGWVGENSRERDAQEILANAQASLVEQQRKARQAEQQAREREAAAEQARRDAEELIGPAHQRVNQLAEENARLTLRHAGAVAMLEKIKQQRRELKAKLKKNDNPALTAEIERLSGMMHDDRQLILKLEERLRSINAAS